MILTEEEQKRFNRHILLKEIGEAGQQKLLNSKVLIIGAGGLGSPLSLYLAAAGIGTIGIIDADTVDISNLQRQVMHTTPDEGKPKVESAAESMKAINPNINIITYHIFFTPDNAAEIVKPYDFIVDATDNFHSKFLINDVCVAAQKPYSYGGVVRFQGMTMTYIPGTSTLRDIFVCPPRPDETETSAQVGILGTIPGIIGTIQATEAIKYLTGIGELLTDKLLTLDALTMQFNTLSIK